MKKTVKKAVKYIDAITPMEPRQKGPADNRDTTSVIQEVPPV